MKYVEIVANASSVDTISAIAEKAKAQDFHVGVPSENNMLQMRMLVGDKALQLALDTLQQILGAQPTARVIVMPVETFLPKPDAEDERSKDSAAVARESLYDEVEKGARLDTNFLALVVLSTVVAAIGLIENNVAVVIGAMVIAPLLGPNLALSLGTALGDAVLMRKSTKAFAAGILLALAMSIALGFFWTGKLDSHELIARTHASVDSIALALASGAAATLSLITGLSSVLVGVMVAVALLPPTVTLGIMLGSGDPHAAIGAGLLLAINIVCVNLSSKILFYVKGIRPRTWFEKEKAKQAMTRYIAGWLITLAALLVFIYMCGTS